MQQNTGIRPPPQRRNPPRYNPQHPYLQKTSSGKGCCLKCLCCCCCTLFILIFILVIAAYIVYATYKPEVPKYKIDKVQVNSFNILPDFSLDTQITAFVKADNPNDHLGFKYGKQSSVTVKYTGATLCSGKLPAFTQPKDNKTTIKIALRGQTEVDSKLQKSLQEDKKAGKIPLLIMIKAPVTVVLETVPLREIVAKINCSVIVDSLAADKPRTHSQFWFKP
ncbi:NDR1/HIN1-like protein 6 [Mangifera indica]|uniref:NDR1/HIN1-like protein 6 n=1 Tax=Mangifera indica TaxID=29780 RepID=UPI001CFAC9D9|nr:NDR1/HIN1-like protein 6 [Mangifera indica]